MANDITELRETLFDTLRQLKDKENPMPIERAKAIGEIAQVVINTAKVEVDAMRLTKSRGTGFLGELPAQGGDPSTPQPTANGTKTVTQVPGGTVTRHTLK